MIDIIELSCGRTSTSTALSLEGLSGITIFVGPNNSGKSVLLDAIYKNLTSNGSSRSSSLKNIRVTNFDESMISNRIEFKDKNSSDMVTIENTTQIKSGWISQFRKDISWQGSIGRQFRKSQCIWMNGTKRLTMLPSEERASLTEPREALAKLLSDDLRRSEFQETVFNGIGYYPFVDRVSQIGTLKLAFSKKRPEKNIERGVDGELVKFVNESLDRESVSDGFNAYVGMIGTIFASDYKCILIDEPEAFLHPALARTLGKQLAQNSHDRHILAASHSADFVMGAIESGAPVQIVRLQFQNDVPTACLLDQNELIQFMNDPLLRSANVLSGLFSKSVVVGESDTDRAFYQEINTRLVTAKDSRGIENAVFLNAQNKQTVPKIVRLLRKMGVPTVGIVDLDVLAEGGANWAHQTSASCIPEALQQTLGTSRQSIFSALKAVSTDNDKKEYKWCGGINLLDKGNKEAADILLSTLKAYGLLVVPIGEVEAWLAELNIARSKSTWLRKVFETLGSRPTDEGYVSPSEGDVWDFIGEANEWLQNSDRKGMSE